MQRPISVLRTLALIAVAIAGSASAPEAQTAAPSPAECTAQVDQRLRLLRGIPAHADLDSVRLADLDSSVVEFQNPRRDPPERAEGGPRIERGPRVLDRAGLTRRMKELYPAHLRQARVRGTAMVIVLVRPDSTVFASRIGRSSGSVELDIASIRVMEAARIAPVIAEGCASWTEITLPVEWGP